MVASVPPREVIVDFLRSVRGDLETIDPDEDLIEGRILDSLHFVEFLYMLEELTGSEILLEEVSPEDFRTISRIERRFFNEDDG